VNLYFRTICCLEFPDLFDSIAIDNERVAPVNVRYPEEFQTGSEKYPISIIILVPDFKKEQT
jgi:hypothetical protein